MRHRTIPITAALLVCSLLTMQQAVAQSGGNVAPNAGSTKPSSDENYVLGPGDVIELQVPGRRDFTTQARIAEDGRIKVPFLGSVDAKNKTARQLGEYLSRALDDGGYFKKPIVEVEITSFASRNVTVLGEVVGEGLQPIDRPYLLSEVLAKAGWLKPTAGDYVILTDSSGQQTRITIEEMMIGDASKDPVISPGDKIFAPKAALFYISGQVHNPGAFMVERGMTLRMAIARAGGITDLGTDKEPKVTDRNGAVRRQALDAPIQEGDAIIVRERLF